MSVGVLAKGDIICFKTIKMKTITCSYTLAIAQARLLACATDTENSCHTLLLTSLLWKIMRGFKMDKTPPLSSRCSLSPTAAMLLLWWRRIPLWTFIRVLSAMPSRFQRENIKLLLGKQAQTFGKLLQYKQTFIIKLFGADKLSVRSNNAKAQL